MNRKNNRKGNDLVKRLTAIVLCVCLCGGIYPLKAAASEMETTVPMTEPTVVTEPAAVTEPTLAATMPTEPAEAKVPAAVEETEAATEALEVTEATEPPVLEEAGEETLEEAPAAKLTATEAGLTAVLTAPEFPEGAELKFFPLEGQALEAAQTALGENAPASLYRVYMVCGGEITAPPEGAFLTVVPADPQNTRVVNDTETMAYGVIPKAVETAAETDAVESEETASHVITFDVGEEARAAGIAAPEAMTVGAVLNADDLPNAHWEINEIPVKCLYGWALDAELTQKVEGEIPVTGDMTLYAMWITHIPGCSDDCGGNLEGMPCGCFCHLMTLEEASQSGSFILVKKVFQGLPSRDLVPGSFRISVTPNPSGNPVTKGLSDAVHVSENGFEYTWKIYAGAGSYQIGESGTDVADYDLIQQINVGESVTVEEPSAVIGLGSERYPSCSNSDIVFPQRPQEGWVIAIAANDGLGVFILSEFELSEAVKNGIRAYTGYPNNSFEPYNGVSFYTVSDYGGDLISIPGTDVTLQYFENEHRVHVGATKQWRQACTLGFSMTDFYNPDITVTNVYRKSVTDVVIKKEITGNMSDWEKKFNFRVTFDQPIGAGEGYELSEDGKTASFSIGMVGGIPESITLKDIPIGAKITRITETNAEGYEMYVGGVKVEGGQTWTGEIEITGEGITVEVRNNKDGYPDTGIVLDSMPYVLLVFTAAAGMVLMMAGKRSRRR